MKVYLVVSSRASSFRFFLLSLFAKNTQIFRTFNLRIYMRQRYSFFHFFVNWPLKYSRGGFVSRKFSDFFTRSLEAVLEFVKAENPTEHFLGFSYFFQLDFALLQMLYQLIVAGFFVKAHGFHNFRESHEIFRKWLLNIVVFLEGCPTHELIVLGKHVHVLY